MHIKLSEKSIVVIGDLILDEYIEGRVERISPEAPVPVVELIKDEHKPGGAANVAVLLSSLGAKVKLAGVIGEDDRGDLLLKLLTQKGIDTSLVVRERKRPTTVKTRIISRSQHIVRLDREIKKPIKEETEKRVLDGISGEMENIDAVLIEDYDKGFVTEKIVEFVRDMNKPVYVDPKVKNMPLYRGISVLKPNYGEFKAALGVIGNLQLDTLYDRVMRFRESQEVRILIVTLGSKGMIIGMKQKLCHIPAIKREVFDVTGAGDMVIAAFTLAELSGYNTVDSAIIASVAAGIEVTKLGATPVVVDEINAVLDEEYDNLKENTKCLQF